jgi:small multidrug resistance family-3 protein
MSVGTSCSKRHTVRLVSVNLPHWDFGKLLGIYVVMFFLVAQVLAKVRFNQAPTAPIYLGGALIVAGGLVIGFWRS